MNIVTELLLLTTFPSTLNLANFHDQFDPEDRRSSFSNSKAETRTHSSKTWHLELLFTQGRLSQSQMVLLEMSDWARCSDSTDDVKALLSQMQRKA